MLADLVVMSSGNRPVVVVEARARKDTDDNWAKQFVHYYLAERPTPNEQFFLLATLERIFIWKFQPGAQIEDPICVLDTHAVVGNMMPQDMESQLTAQSFETVIHIWLSGLLSIDSTIADTVPSQLVDIGFVAAIQNGSVSSVPAV